MKLLIRNGRVCFENAVEVTDILVENGKVAALGSFSEAIRSAKVIDAKGLVRGEVVAVNNELVRDIVPKGACLCRN